MNKILNEFNRNCILIRRQIIVCHLYQSNRYNLKGRKKEPFRKPIWEPMAPSKLFRIRNKPIVSDEERQQREQMEETFVTNMRSIQDFFHKEFYLPTLSAGGLSSEVVLKEEVNQKELIDENNRENERIARIRDERTKKLDQLIDQKMIVQYLEQTEELKQKSRKIDEMVRQEIKRSETYITRETLEACIEEALSHPISYDFAIDINGNIHSDQPLHPYALKPNAVPESNSNINDFSEIEEMPQKLEPKVLY